MPVKRSTIYLLPYGRNKVLQLTSADRKRFNRRLEKRGECLVWTGSIEKNGYGLFWVPKYNKTVLAHRAAWVFAGYEITEEEPFVLHDCPNRDDKACCNPDHLRIGTNFDNRRDYHWKREVESGMESWPQRSKPRSYGYSPPPPSDNEVKLLGLKRRPTSAEVVGRKPRKGYHRRTCRELYEARKAAWLAKKHQLEMEKLERKRQREARVERSRARRERDEALRDLRGERC